MTRVPTSDVALPPGVTFRSADPEFADGIAGWNLAVEHHPAVLVRPQNAAEVGVTLQYAADTGLPVCVQLTGHGVAVAGQGGVHLSTAALDTLSVDPERRVARIGAGLRWGDVVRAAAEHGLAPACGSSPGVGALGYLAGGGLPVTGRTVGFSGNLVRSMDVVTADGCLRTASADSEPELFWGLRGSRGNLGVVVSAEVDLLPIRRFYGGSLTFDGRLVEHVLRRYVTWTPDLPTDTTTSVVLMRFPDLPQVPEQVRGRFLVNVRVVSLGDMEAGERLVQPLRDLGPEVDEVGDMPYTDLGNVYHDPPRPTPARARSTLLRDFSVDAVDALLAVAGKDAEFPFGGIEIRHLGGALTAASEASGAVGECPWPFLVFMSNPAFDDRLGEVEQAQAAVLGALAPWDTGTTLPGFLFTHDAEAAAVERCYPADTFRKLRQLKALYDPSNLLRVNHNIPPLVTA